MEIAEQFFADSKDIAVADFCRCIGKPDKDAVEAIKIFDGNLALSAYKPQVFWIDEAVGTQQGRASASDDIFALPERYFFAGRAIITDVAENEFGLFCIRLKLLTFGDKAGAFDGYFGTGNIGWIGGRRGKFVSAVVVAATVSAVMMPRSQNSAAGTAGAFKVLLQAIRSVVQFSLHGICRLIGNRFCRYIDWNKIFTIYFEQRQIERMKFTVCAV